MAGGAEGVEVEFHFGYEVAFDANAEPAAFGTADADDVAVKMTLVFVDSDFLADFAFEVGVVGQEKTDFRGGSKGLNKGVHLFFGDNNGLAIFPSFNEFEFKAL